MKTEFILTAFTDHEAGALGWGIGHLDSKFDDLNACTEGRLLAHDLLEHNHESHLEGVENELEAVGAVDYIRGNLQLENDVLFIAGHRIYNPMKRPENVLSFNDTHMSAYVHEGAKMIGREYDTHELTTEQRKNLSDFLRYAPTYMQQGYDWAEQYYSEVNVSAMFTSIQESFISADYEGQQYKIVLDFTNNRVMWQEYYEYDEYEDY